jgi:hypothetical protein
MMLPPLTLLRKKTLTLPPLTLTLLMLLKRIKSSKLTFNRSFSMRT